MDRKTREKAEEARAKALRLKKQLQVSTLTKQHVHEALRRKGEVACALIENRIMLRKYGGDTDGRPTANA